MLRHFSPISCNQAAKIRRLSKALTELEAHQSEVNLAIDQADSLGQIERLQDDIEKINDTLNAISTDYFLACREAVSAAKRQPI